MKKFRLVLVSALVGALAVTLLPASSQASVGDLPDANVPTFNGTVHTVAHRGNRVFVGGSFTRVTDLSGVHVRRGAAAFNALTGELLPWNPRVTGRVFRIVATKGGVYLGGSFRSVRGIKRKNVAKVALGGVGRVDKRFRHRTDGPVHAIAVRSRRIYLGGDFATVDGKNRVKLASIVRRPPFKLTKWAPKAQIGRVTDLVAVPGAKIYVAGEFREFNNQPQFQRLALVSTKTGNLVTGFNPRVNVLVWDIAVSGSRVYAALGGPNGGQFWGLSRTTGASELRRRFDGDAQALVVSGGEIYVGGHFNKVCNTDALDQDICLDGHQFRRRLASFTPAGDLTGWDPAGDSALGVVAMDAFGGSVAAGGDFLTMSNGSIPSPRFAVFRP